MHVARDDSEDDNDNDDDEDGLEDDEEPAVPVSKTKKPTVETKKPTVETKKATVETKKPTVEKKRARSPVAVQAQVPTLPIYPAGSQSLALTDRPIPNSPVWYRKAASDWKNALKATVVSHYEKDRYMTLRVYDPKDGSPLPALRLDYHDIPMQVRWRT